MPVNAHGQPVGAAVPGWHPRQQPTRTPLQGRFCRLEPLDPAHADDLFAAYCEAPDGRDWTYLPVEQFEDRAAYRAFVAGQARSSDPLHFAILVDGKAVGAAALMRIEPASGVVEVGHIAFSPRLQRTPAGTEALFLLMRRVFDELGYRRLEWKCDSLNEPSRRAALRYGFSYEGLFRQAIVTKGRNRDTAWFSMLDTEWPRLRTSFEAWLSAGNFDAQGAQKRSLAACRAEEPSG